jgi:hypothetical protein
MPTMGNGTLAAGAGAISLAAAALFCRRPGLDFVFMILLALPLQRVVTN